MKATGKLAKVRRKAHLAESGRPPRRFTTRRLLRKFLANACDLTTGRTARVVAARRTILAGKKRAVRTRTRVTYRCIARGETGQLETGSRENRARERSRGEAEKRRGRKGASRRARARARAEESLRFFEKSTRRREIIRRVSTPGGSQRERRSDLTRSHRLQRRKRRDGSALRSQVSREKAACRQNLDGGRGRKERKEARGKGRRKGGRNQGVYSSTTGV